MDYKLSRDLTFKNIPYFIRKTQILKFYLIVNFINLYIKAL